MRSAWHMGCVCWNRLKSTLVKNGCVPASIKVHFAVKAGSWSDNRKHITFTRPNGRKCRDNSLHDETFLKENLETLFAYRQAVGFTPGTMEPEIGWMGELANALVQLGKSVEKRDDLPPLSKTPMWSDSKQLRREAIKKLALGQKLSRDDSQTMRMW